MLYRLCQNFICTVQISSQASTNLFLSCIAYLQSQTSQHDAHSDAPQAVRGAAQAIEPCFSETDRPHGPGAQGDLIRTRLLLGKPPKHYCLLLVSGTWHAHHLSEFEYMSSRIYTLNMTRTPACCLYGVSPFSCVGMDQCTELDSYAYRRSRHPSEMEFPTVASRSISATGARRS